MKNYVFISDSDYSEIIITACNPETAKHNLNDIVKHPKKYRLDERYDIIYKKN